MWNKEKIEHSDTMNEMQVRDLRKKISNYEEDPKKEIRLKRQLCKNCFYLRDGLAGQAFTKSECRNCGGEIMNPTTSTNRICDKCAKEQGLCVKCGGHI